jgi:hypothetical protein
MPLVGPAALPNSHDCGGRVFLNFAANPRNLENVNAPSAALRAPWSERLLAKCRRCSAQA